MYEYLQAYGEVCVLYPALGLVAIMIIRSQKRAGEMSSLTQTPSLQKAGRVLTGLYVKSKGHSRELVDGVVEVTGVKFNWEMSKSSQSSVSCATPTLLK